MTKASRLRKILAIGVAAMLGAVSSPAAEISDWPPHDWSILSNLAPQSLVTIKPLKGRGKKLRGEFLSSDTESIIVRNRDGQQVTVSREEGRRVFVRRSRGGRAPWYGAAVGAGTGAGLAAAAFAGSGESGEAAPFVIGTAVVLAGVGALSGLLVQRFSRDRLVYQSPKR